MAQGGRGGTVTRIDATEVHPPPEEPARLAAVRRYGILDTPPVRAFDRVASLAARVLAAPLATVSFVDEERVWFKAHRGLDQRQTPRAPGLGASAILHRGAHLVPDTAADPAASANPLVTELGVRFYAGWPISTPDGYRIGTVDVMDVQPRQVDPDDLAALADLATMVADELELRLSAGRTLEAERIGQLEHALEHRIVVEQAKGVLMGREDLSVREAFERLRAVARSRRRPVEELARDVVAGRPLPAVTHSTRQRPRGGSGGARDRQPPAARRGRGAPNGDGDVSEVYDQGLRITRRRSPPGLRLQGEVDRSNLSSLAAALAGVVETSGDVHLDLTALEFIDVAGLRLLTEEARRMPAGRYLVLDGVAPYVRRILALVGWDQAPGLKIGGGQP